MEVKKEIFGLQINTDTKAAIVAAIGDRAAQRQKTLIVTPYSEFFYYAAKDYRFRNIVNGADFALPDGKALQWLADYYRKPITVRNYYIKIIQAVMQEISSGFAVLLSTKRSSAIIPERITGADFFWDIMAEADRRSQKVFLLGGFGDTAFRASRKVLERYPNLQIRTSNANPNELMGIEEINEFQPNYLLVAYGPVKQEYWISEHLLTLPVAVAIGIGGTLDYVSGNKKRAPKFIRAIGMEWAHRLVTQPYRVKRIWHATVSLALGAVRDKVFRTLGYRMNAAGVILNAKKQVLVVCRCREQTQPGKDAHWQLPQGGIEKGETPEQGVLREMHEELGTDSFTILGRCKTTYSYEWQHFFRPLFWNTRRYQGQLQYIIYLQFKGADADFSLDTHEIDSFRWVQPEDLPNYIHPMRHAMLTVALSELQSNIANIQ
jgi:N-acetylglucosaminyldiphosphoundecaprenol N-acetyl-beta-D-mannosaminyltransferase